MEVFLFPSSLTGIFGSARHVDGLSDQAFLDKFRLPPPAVEARCQTICTRISRPDLHVPCFSAASIGTWVLQVLRDLRGEHEAPKRDAPVPSAEPSAENPPEAPKIICCECSQLFASLHNLKTHESKAHKKTHVRLTVPPQEHGLNGLPTCRHCGVDFSKWDALKRRSVESWCHKRCCESSEHREMHRTDKTPE